jgi:hypothetical protein
VFDYKIVMLGVVHHLVNFRKAQVKEDEIDRPCSKNGGN